MNVSLTNVCNFMHEITRFLLQILLDQAIFLLTGTYRLKQCYVSGPCWLVVGLVVQRARFVYLYTHVLPNWFHFEMLLVQCSIYVSS